MVEVAAELGSEPRDEAGAVLGIKCPMVPYVSVIDVFEHACRDDRCRLPEIEEPSGEEDPVCPSVCRHVHGVGRPVRTAVVGVLLTPLRCLAVAMIDVVADCYL